jgi:deoxycytidylate deaminase
MDDRRCYAWGARCYNDKNKNEILDQLWSLIEDTVNRHQDTSGGDVELTELKNKLRYAIRSSSKVRSLTEFSRAIHAEMDAIISVARKSLKGLVGSTLYVTTFPCHNCAKHIIGSGIHRVVYLEPYEKSLARELHSDAINDPKAGKDPKKVAFDIYGGVSPYKFDAFFRMREERNPRDGSGLFLDHDRERHVRLPFMAQELSQLEMNLQGFYDRMNQLASDTTQLPLPLRQ